jgi:glycosyltransferase involved in cell wall biosynthesis
MKQDNLLSIIICTLGSRDIIKRCLDSIYIENTQSIKYEVIVVDQSSTHNIERLCMQYRDVIWVSSKNKGLSLNRNIGLSMANGQWLYFLDDDAWLDQKFFINIKSSLKNVKTPSVVIIDALRNDTGKYYVNRFNPNKIYKINSKNLSPIFTICSLSAIFSKDVFNIVGSFDENLGAGAVFPSCEETDILIRASIANISFKYIPNTRAFHPPYIINIDDSMIAKAYKRAHGHGALYKKHSLKNKKIQYFFYYKIIAGIIAPFLKSVLYLFSCRLLKSKLFLFISIGKFKGFLLYNR